MDNSHERLREAVTELINAPNAAELYEALTLLIPLALGGHPVKLSGEAAALNPLLELRVRHPEGYKNVLQLIEKHRAGAGLAPLVCEDAPAGYDKTSYMRAFMDQKRQRQHRAATIENLLRPEHEQLVGAARLEFMRRQSQVWKEQRDRFIEASRGPHQGCLTKEKTQEVLARFWSAVDDDLDDREAKAREEALKPVHLRRHPDASLDALLHALEFDPYKTKPPAN